MLDISFTVGCGLTFIVNVRGKPMQPEAVTLGVTVIAEFRIVVPLF